MNGPTKQLALTDGQRWWREERLPEIEETAYRELTLYEQKFGKIFNEAIPIEKIVTDLWGLKIVPADLRAGGYDIPPGTEGFLDHTQRIILLDINCTEAQRRFTLACEGGHWVLHRRSRPAANQLRLLTEDRFYRPDSEPGWEHRESQFFAACLLLPRFKFEPLAQQLLTGARLDDNRVLLSEVVEILAMRFNVAKQTARIRLEELKLITPTDKGWFELECEREGPLFER